MKKILLLEHKPQRVAEGQAALTALGLEVQLLPWDQAAIMIREAPDHLASAALISLDYDLLKPRRAVAAPGNGLEVAKWLAGYPPLCPVLVHATAPESSLAMQNTLNEAGWRVEHLVLEKEEAWSAQAWAARVRGLLALPSAAEPVVLPADHAVRWQRALAALEGLSIGDALGEMFFYRHGEAASLVEHNCLPPAPWFHTDDTEMAISIVEVLRLRGAMHQDTLARRFAARFREDPERGYGSMTRLQLLDILEGKSWRDAAAAAFGGQGSMGNGSAMRVAPVGAYYAGDAKAAARAAELSSTVTHTHPEGVAGAVAVAVAASSAWELRAEPVRLRVGAFFDAVMRHTPPGQVHTGLEKAARLKFRAAPEAANVLGNGAQVTAPDTVPFAIWCAAQNLGHYPKAVMAAISGGGDCDTTAAIAGGIVAAGTGLAGIPETWLARREELPFPAVEGGRDRAPARP
jgi:ADP-ribosylglycohydrolase